MYRNSWPTIPPQNITANGTISGVLSVQDATPFKIGQAVVIQSNGNVNLSAYVQEVTSYTSLKLCAASNLIGDIDLTTVLTSNNPTIFAKSQLIPPIREPEALLAGFEQAPTNAYRTFGVDALGQPFTAANPMPVRLSDGSVNIGTLNQNLEVQLTAKDNFPKAGEVHDSIRIGDGSYELAVNPDGSINVTNQNSAGQSFTTKNTFLDVQNIPSGIQTDLASYTVPIGKTAILERVIGSGQQIARFDLFLNSNVIDTQRSSYGTFNIKMDFSSTGTGYLLNAGDIVVLKVTQGQPDLGDFNARIQVRESN
jgi:hypothetical protein